jgi:hypothetical protein
MGKKDKGATAVRDRTDARARQAADIARESVHQVADSAQRLTGVGAKKAHEFGEVGTRKARRANKKMKKSVRRHPAGWGAAALGLLTGVILGIVAKRRRQRQWR